MIARHEQYLPIAAQRVSQLIEDGLSAGEGVAQRPMAQLENVAQQHQAIDALKRIQQRRLLRRQTQRVDAAERTEVQV
jgi:FlaA1/EpsC-like NDP-sugar epimerase